MYQWPKLPTDVEEVENANNEDSDNEAVEDAAVWNETGNESDDESGKKECDDDGVDDVPHVGVEHAELLTQRRRLTDKELSQHHETCIS